MAAVPPSAPMSTPSRSASVSAGRSSASQWVKRPPGASGSSTTIDRLFVAAGAALQVSGGDLSAPSQVASTGMAAPAPKEELVTVSDAREAPCGGEGCPAPDLQPPGRTVRAAAAQRPPAPGSARARRTRSVAGRARGIAGLRSVGLVDDRLRSIAKVEAIELRLVERRRTEGVPADAPRGGDAEEALHRA